MNGIALCLMSVLTSVFEVGPPKMQGVSNNKIKLSNKLKASNLAKGSKPRSLLATVGNEYNSFRGTIERCFDLHC